MKQEVELIKRVAAETGVTPSKVDRMVEWVQDLPKAKNVWPLIDILANCP